jgi:cathepsin B
MSSPEYAAAVVSRVANDIPASFLANATWTKCSSIAEIRDQANCGSCWAFGAAEAMTDRYCIASNQTTNPRISMENVLTCCGACGYGCGGGYPIQAWKYWVSTGIVSGDGNGDN